WRVGKATLHGTLLRPVPHGIEAGVVLVAGSGPTDRDWNSPLLAGTNGSGKLLAEALAAAGIASLRYDKSAAGPHAVENIAALDGLTMQHHTDELAGAVRVLAEESSADRIFGLGNSEGTLHVLHYQLGDPAIPLAGLVLAAPPGRSVGEVGRAQLAAQAALIPNGEALLLLYDEAIARFLRGEPAAPDPALPGGVQTLLQGVESPMNLPFARELWLADASSLLGRVDRPALVVIGKKDIQVHWKDDGELLQRAAAGRTDVTFAFPEDANHVLKHEPRPLGSVTAEALFAAYNADDAALDPEATATVVDWLRRQAGLDRR
ncbi:MAG: alpha/beta hydrolase, partial [Gaiellaceae bacterium]